MDALAELIMSPVYSIKSKNPSQDKKQNQSNENAFKKPQPRHATKNKLEQFSVKQRNAWGVNERRAGKERRKKIVERGRWLESREAKDRRRTSSDIFVKV